MTKKLLDAVKAQKKATQPSELEILGSMGQILNGVKTVEVANRNSYVYVRLRDNSNEVVQAFNNQVSPSYNLPVLLQWQDNRYIVLGVDTARYQNNWPSFAPYLPRHGTQHSFSEPPGGDVAWIYSRQFMPMLPFPSGSNGASQLIINSSVYRNPDGTWEYIGGSGTADLTLPKPTDSQARMLLLYWDLDTGSPASLTGSFFSSSLTGTSEVLPYIPTISDSQKIPLVGVRLVSGTSSIGWDNIYDVRQFAVNVPPAFAGGFGIWDEGVPQGTGTILNFVGEGVTVTISGTVARVNVTATGGGGVSSPWTTGSAGSFSITTIDGSNDSKGNRALSHGENTLALGANSHAEGSASIATGSNSHAEGQETLSFGQASHSEGIATEARGIASHAEGTSTLASGSYSHAEGENNSAYGYGSNVAGGFNEAHGNYSAIIAGILNSVVGNYSSVLAGQGITGSAPDTAYTDYMNVRSLGAGTSLHNIGIDAEGFLVTGTSGGGSVVWGDIGGSVSNQGDLFNDQTGVVPISIADAETRTWISGSDYIPYLTPFYTLKRILFSDFSSLIDGGGGSGAERFWTSGTAGVNSIRTLHGSGDAQGNYATAIGSANYAKGPYSFAAGGSNESNGEGSAILAGLGGVVSGSFSSIIAGIGNAVTGQRSSVLSGISLTGTANDTAYADYVNVRRLRNESVISNIGISANGFLVTGTTGNDSGWVSYSNVIPTRASADDPTYTLQFAGVDLTDIFEEGQPIKLTQNSIVRYGWISSAPSYSGGNTTVTVLTRTDSASGNYDILDTGTYPITNFAYGMKGTIPFGMPGKASGAWDLIVTNTTQYTKTSPVANTRYGQSNAMDGGATLPSIVVSIGGWDLSYSAQVRETTSVDQFAQSRVSLSTSTSAETDGTLTRVSSTNAGFPSGGTLVINAPLSASKIVSLTSKTTYYILISTSGANGGVLELRGDQSTTLIRASCAYL